MIVKPRITVTPDYPVVQFNEPRELVDLPTELTRIMGAQGWGVGVFFYVQFVNHERTKLLATGLHVVTSHSEKLVTSDAGPYSTNTRTVAFRECALVGDWWEAEAAPAEQKKAAAQDEAEPKSAKKSKAA